MDTIRVAITGIEADQLVAIIEKNFRQLTVMQHGFDVAECVALAEAGSIDTAIILGTTEELTLSVIERFHQHRVTVIITSDLVEERQRCFQLGAEALALSVDAAEIVAVIERSAQHNTFSYRDAADLGFESIRAENFELENTGLVEDEETVELPHQDGTKLVTLWGPLGSPGTSTLALNAAAEYLIAGKRTLLIDADSYAASVAVLLGLQEESSGLSQLCRVADLGNLSAQSFETVVERVEIKGHVLEVLTGLPQGNRWPELRSAALDEVFRIAKQLYDVVVVDTAAPIEQDEELSFDVAVPQRNAATLRALYHADLVLAIGSADVIGMPRFFKQIPELLDLIQPETKIMFAANKVSKDTLGRQAADQLLYTWLRFGPSQHEHLHLLPDASSDLSNALMSGECLAEHASGSLLRQSLQQFLELPVTETGRSLFGSKFHKRGSTAKLSKKRGRRVKT